MCICGLYMYVLTIQASSLEGDYTEIIYAARQKAEPLHCCNKT